MHPSTPRLPFAVAASLIVAGLAACNGSGEQTPIGPGPGAADTVLVLNSTGQTIARFAVRGDSLAVAGGPIDQGAAFDGASMDATPTHAVTTISAFGGSRILFTDLATGAVQSLAFRGADSSLANPSRARFDAAGTAWFSARQRDAIYSAMPGDTRPTQLRTNVGTFVETVVPVPGGVAAIDAFLDDDGGTYAPLGPSRVFLLGATAVDTVRLPDGSLNALDAVVAGGKLVVLLGGTFTPDTFEPAGNGGIVTVDPGSLAVSDLLPIGGNGVAIERGADGRVYVTATNDFLTLTALSFDAASGDFVAGPEAPLDLRGTNGARLNCWVVTALDDGRMLCATFSTVEQGRLNLLEEDGSGLDWVNSGFGTTDILLR